LEFVEDIIFHVSVTIADDGYSAIDVIKLLTAFVYKGLRNAVVGCGDVELGFCWKKLVFDIDSIFPEYADNRLATREMFEAWSRDKRVFENLNISARFRITYEIRGARYFFHIAFDKDGITADSVLFRLFKHLGITTSVYAKTPAADDCVTYAIEKHVWAFEREDISIGCVVGEDGRCYQKLFISYPFIGDSVGDTKYVSVSMILFWFKNYEGFTSALDTTSVYTYHCDFLNDGTERHHVVHDVNGQSTSWDVINMILAAYGIRDQNGNYLFFEYCESEGFLLRARFPTAYDRMLESRNNTYVYSMQ